MSQSTPQTGLRKATTKATVGGCDANALIDTGSSSSFINKHVAESLGLEIVPSSQEISMAVTTFKTSIHDSCFAMFP